MSELDSPVRSPARRRRAKVVLFGIGFAFLLSICLVLGWWWHFWAQAANQLKLVIDNLDQQNPGWRWDELQAKRAALPDEENAAIQVQAAFKLLPRGWPNRPAPPDEEPADQKSLIGQILELEPVTQLSGAQTKE